MTIFLLILIAIMLLVTMICSIITTIIEVKDEHANDLVKKVLKVTGIVLAVIAVIGAAVGISYLKKDDSNQNKTITLETAGFNELSLNEYLEVIKKDEKSIILVARPTCPYCEKFSPILKEAMDDMNLTINYIDTDKFSNEDWTTFSESLAYLNSEEWGTPLILIVQNGEVIAENNGYVDLSTIKSFFKANGYEG